MGDTNRREILAIVLGSVMVLGVVGGGFTAAAAATASDGPAETTGSALAAVQDDDGEDDESDEAGQENETEEGDAQENETDGQQPDRIPITEAMQAAEDETQDRNATVVGAELGQRGGLLDFGDDDESVYTVDALLANGTHVEVAVNATNGSVVDVAEQDEGFLEGIFGEEQVPDRPLNLSAMYDASEAVELAQNETGDNGTVTSVRLDDRDGDLVYDVQIDQGDDGETTVVVDAMRDGAGVIEVDGEQMDGEETGTEGDGDEGNQTGEDGTDGGMDDGNDTDEGDGM